MVSNTAEIGIFGGTGIYDSELLQDSKEIRLKHLMVKHLIQLQ